MYFRNIFLSKVKQKLSELMLKASLKIRSPYLVAISLAFVLKSLSCKKKYKILAIVKDISSQDIQALNDFGHDIQYVCVSVGVLKWILIAVMGDDYKRLNTRNYEELDSAEESRKRHYSFLRKMVPLFNKLSGIDGVLACNFTYISLRELAKVYHELKVPYFIMYKEGGMLPERKQDWQEHWKECFFAGTSYASMIFTYNDSISWVFTSSGYKGLENDKIITTGSPRLDYYRANGIAKHQGRKKLVLFAFDPIFSCYYFNEIWRSGETSKLAVELRSSSLKLYKLVREFAKKYPEIDVVIKFKYPGDFGPYIKGILDEFGSELNSNIKNLSLVSDYSAKELILTSTAIISFNSTTAIEAILCKKPVLTPDFRECFDGKAWSYFEKFPELLNYVSSLEDIENIMFNDEAHSVLSDDICDNFVKTHGGVGKYELSTNIVEKNLIEVIENNCL
jgi:hypothetical protein